MSEQATYTGGCHCGKVRYEAKTGLDNVVACNCSICSKSGYLLAFVPERDFRLLSGQGELCDYQFAKRHIHHLFCTNCGVRSFARGTAADGATVYAVNVRCLDNIDLDRIKAIPFDGKSL